MLGLRPALLCLWGSYPVVRMFLVGGISIPMPVELISSDEAVAAIVSSTGIAVERINGFSRTMLRTRGGRFGSGMGTLLEALWGYHVNQQLYDMYDEAQGCELAWLLGHEYNDFACVGRSGSWDPDSRTR